MEKDVVCSRIRGMGQEIRLDKRGTSSSTATCRKQKWCAGSQGSGGSSHEKGFVFSVKITGVK